MERLTTLQPTMLMAPMHIEHSYIGLQGGTWMKGNLHCHTTRSDGKAPPQGVVDAYAALRHDFLMLSDHDVANTADELTKLDAKGMLLIPGYEITAQGVHMLHVNANAVVKPLPDRQATIEAAIQASGSFVIVNHPNWFAEFNHCTHDKLEAWQGYAGIEIYNAVIEFLEGSPLATDHWDRLLSHGRRVWGYANDDSHDAPHRGIAWNVAYVRERNVAGVVEALASGRFYGSTGVTISEIKVEGDRITIASPDADRIVMFGKSQRRLALVDGQTLSVVFPASEPYVRFECLGRGGRCAWTQPLFAGK